MFPAPEKVALTSHTAARCSDDDAHYLGHRRRLRARFLAAGNDALSDYEMLELILFRAIPRGDLKPLAKALLGKFGSFAEVISAPRTRLQEVHGIGDAAIAELKIVQAAASRLARGEVRQRPVLSSWASVLDYCRTAMAFADREQFQILFLDKRNRLIADEQHQTGTVDHTPVYPREVVKRALELSATALILVHNHPSGDPTPSRADVEMTRAIIDVARPLGIAVHDHIIVGKDGHASLKALKLIWGIHYDEASHSPWGNPREERAELELTPTELARQLEVPANRISQIIQGKRSITGDTALRLGHWFGTSAQFWLNLQSAHDIRLAAQQAGAEIARLPMRSESGSRLRRGRRKLA